jgi:hypothetical protein
MANVGRKTLEAQPQERTVSRAEALSRLRRCGSPLYSRHKWLLARAGPPCDEDRLRAFAAEHWEELPPVADDDEDDEDDQ